jgi:cytochrome c oxidase assembly protein subunit 15
MFLYPVAKWTGGIVYEHVHRLLASVIGFLTIIVLVMVWRVDHRRWMKRLALVALGAVIVQGLLGGLTVLMRLPTAVSVSHAMLAQSFMLTAMAMAAATSKRWLTGPVRVAVEADAGLQRLLLATVCFTFVQILLGAVTRHTYSGPAITDFPLSNGRVIPEFTSFGVAIQFAHRVGALVLTTLIFAQGVRVFRTPSVRALRTPAGWLMAVVIVQVLMGATVIWTRLAIVPNTAHVAVGAITFALAFLTYFQSTRWYTFRQTSVKGAVHVEGAHA